MNLDFDKADKFVRRYLDQNYGRTVQMKELINAGRMENCREKWVRLAAWNLSPPDYIVFFTGFGRDTPLVVEEKKKLVDYQI